MNILSQIVRDTLQRVKKEKKKTPIEELNYNDSSNRSLSEAIKSHSETPVIGELKKTSPSSNEIRSNFPVVKLAESIANGGAAGISVLTEPDYFDGSMEYIKKVKAAVDIPILRKDFIVDEYQIYQTAAVGADAVLLIAEVLEDKLPIFVDLTKDLDMEPLVEIRNEDQANLAEAAEADLIGINNRDLNTMKTDLSRTENLIEQVLKDSVIVSESGVESRKDVERLLKAGSDAVLVGTAIMKSNNVEDKVRNLVFGDNHG
ncbi:hypothetical protein AKJ53_01600 [candidate division MSBL1 archaeon SCGC-AAA382F02]|uniref:Indole-3-glycerol phosphate synthase n=1 Tax=candidate division MSBL1 archaeon SCGC-AAA382F02 TaxID=1698282 RepID=A0A133VHT2_9EURY|nr:hypothetical protein AKJ53_01600 [candidate division MSBL1 archaeon SCGC-AAA382F02]